MILNAEARRSGEDRLSFEFSLLPGVSAVKRFLRNKDVNEDMIFNAEARRTSSYVWFSPLLRASALKSVSS
jgi:hypothetical protein